MPNRCLTAAELIIARRILDEVRTRIASEAGEDQDLLFALRRKIYKELTYDERGKPMARRSLKLAKRIEQNGLCAVCAKPLPQTYTVLDRFEAMAGYTRPNTRLICRPCDEQTQHERGFS